MEKTVFVASIVLFNLITLNALAQTTTITDLRIGMQDRATYHYAEVFQIRDRWIVPDIGYIDFASASQYREWFVGAGYKFLMTKHVTVTEILYFIQTAGPASGEARYLQPLTILGFSLSPRISGQTAFLFYVPLDSRGTKQFVLDKVKLEYSLTSIFRAGAGYGAYQFGNEKWQHKPFIAVTLTPASGKYGSLELWAQQLPDGRAQAQVRYSFALK